MRRLVNIPLLLWAAAMVALGSASAQDIPPTSDASRVQDLLRVRWSEADEADVCLRDVNGDGVGDFLVVDKGARPGEDLTDFQKALVRVGFAVVALDAVLEVKKDSQDWRVELVYLQAFDRLYEVPLSAIADCTGSIEDKDYKACLARSYMSRERTDAYPTLPSCPNAGRLTSQDDND